MNDLELNKTDYKICRNERRTFMNVAEHRLTIFHQLEELSEESLLEVENLVAKLKMNQKEKKFNPKQFFAVSRITNIDKQLEEMRNEWER